MDPSQNRTSNTKAATLLNKGININSVIRRLVVQGNLQDLLLILLCLKNVMIQHRDDNMTVAEWKKAKMVVVQHFCAGGENCRGA